MAFDVNVFKAAVANNNEFLRTNKFKLHVPMPRGITSVVDVNGNTVSDTSTEGLSFMCKSAALPGLGFLTSDTYTYGYGPMERKPYGAVVNDMMTQFYVDGQGRTRTFIKTWMNLAINTDSRSKFTNNAYNIGYKDQYAVDLKIITYDQEGTPRLETTLIEAYPNFMGDISVDWDEKNRIMTMPVAFTYRDWYEDLIV